MKSYRNLIASGIISLMWLAIVMVAAYFEGRFPLLFVVAGGLTVGFFFTYQIIRLLEYIPDVLQRPASEGEKSKRSAEDWLDSLSDFELDRLRQRLREQDAEEDETYESMDHLLRQRSSRRSRRDN
jgi:hypothetical protein